VAFSFSDFNAALFQPRKGQVFSFQSEAGELVRLELLEVTTYQGSGVPGLRAEPFTLVFRSVDFEPCPMSVLRIQPPAGSQPGAVYYEAVFN
jgi:Domain of unknown function (DUF6916)